MSLIYNGTTIPEHGGVVLYNGTYLDRVIYNSVVVWTRTFTLTITTDPHVSASVTRTSSPLGGSLTALSSGSDIYHNDVLAVSASVTTAGYTVDPSSRSPTSASSITVETYDLHLHIKEYVLDYQLFLNGGTGVASASVTRTSSPLKGASTGVIRTLTTPGLTAIYYGDTLTVSATASSGYGLNYYQSSYTVSDTISISITAYKILSDPVISIVSHGRTSMRVSVSNPNGIACSLSISATGTTALGDEVSYESYSGTISAGGSDTYTLAASGGNATSGSATAVLSATGYNTTYASDSF